MAPAGHKKIADVPGIQRSIGNARSPARIYMNHIISLDPESFRVVHIDSPVSKGNRVFVDSLPVIILLAHYIIAYQAPALSYSHYIVEPGQLAVLIFPGRIGIMVLGIVPKTDVYPE
ncbi:hypothetical protein ES703_119901 [subsurface metagenome]